MNQAIAEVGKSLIVMFVRQQGMRNEMSYVSGKKAFSTKVLTMVLASGYLALPVAAQLKQAPPAVVPPQVFKPAAPAAKAPDDTVIIQQGKPIVGKTRKWQRFSDYINLKAGQDSAPLTLSFQNGTDLSTAFEELRISLAGKILASEKDFKNRQLALNMTGQLGVGGTQLLVDAYGPLDATLSWKLTTKKVQLTSVNPSTIAPGDKVTLVGKNFTAAAQVTIGKAKAKVNTASGTQLQITVPGDVESGKQSVIVTIGGIASAPQTVTVKAAPQVTGIDTLSAPPGQQVTIQGKGFSSKGSDNQVTFNGTPASIVSASGTALTVIVPELSYPQWNVEIKVKTNGIDGKGSASINIQQRVIPNDGVPES